MRRERKPISIEVQCEVIIQPRPPMRVDPAFKETGLWQRLKWALFGTRPKGGWPGEADLMIKGTR